MSGVVEVIKAIENNSPLYFKHCLKIKTKLGSIEPFVPNKQQQQILGEIDEWKRKYPDEKTRPTLFMIVLKCRQIGVSTCIEGSLFKELNFQKNKIALVISYDDDSAQNISDIADRFHQYLPEQIRPMRRPARGKGLLLENPNSMDKDRGLQSKLLVETARNLNAGSSFTINYLHISELAKWTNAQVVLTSLMQAVPDKNGIVIIESTACGMEYFYNLWKLSVAGKTKYIPIFFGWQDFDDYTLPFKDQFEKMHFMSTLDEEEQLLIEEFKVTAEQLNWRRDTIANKCNNDINIFHQEYPCKWEEAFLGSGRPVFDVHLVNKRRIALEKQFSEKPAYVCEVDYDDETGKYAAMANPYGTVRIYEMPRPNVPYVIGGDIAEGLKDGDWSVSCVIDNTTGRQVAVQRMHCEPDVFAKYQLKLARFYNNALVCDEVNNHGLTTIKELQNMGYWHQYKRETMDEISRKKSQKFGFKTTVVTRPRIIDRLRAYVREDIELINDLDTLDEMLTFIYTDTGKEEADVNCHDDTIIALALALEARTQTRSHADFPKEMPKFEGEHWSVIMDKLGSAKAREAYYKYIKKRRKTYGLHDK